MTRLTRIAILTRKIIRFAIIGAVVLVIARIVINLGSGVYKNYISRKTPPPTTAFGKLPQIPFPLVNKDDLPKFTYTLETIDGALPKLVTQAKVYFMPKSSTNLLSLDSARLTASLLGFSQESEQVTQTVYRFNSPKLPSKLELNIATHIFSISYDLKDFFVDNPARPPAPEVAVDRAKSTLSKANIMPADLTGNTTNEFLRVENKNLVGVPSLSEANLVKVNLFRKDYDKLPSLPPYPSQANVWFLMGASGIIAGDFYYFPVDDTKFATYPIKTTQAAYDELKDGKGYISSLGKNQDGSVTIRKVYLAYYDPDVTTDYFQPIYVFEGDRNFFAYVPAITQDYYAK